MSRNDLASQLAAIDSRMLMYLLSVIMALSVSALVGTILFYAAHFGGDFSTQQDVWGQFGDYVGGVLNPILSFLALMALILTVLLQSRQLEIGREQLVISREELAATREELKRSADSQAETAQALAAQAKFAMYGAKLSALSKALDIQSEVLSQSRGGVRPIGFDSEVERRKKQSLTEEVLALTDELCRLSQGVG